MSADVIATSESATDHRSSDNVVTGVLQIADLNYDTQKWEWTYNEDGF